jgi:hypothetical protein
MRVANAGPRDPVAARGVAGTRMAAGGHMRLNTVISSSYQSVSESYHLIRKSFFPQSFPLQLRAPINLKSNRQVARPSAPKKRHEP